VSILQAVVIADSSSRSAAIKRGTDRFPQLAGPRGAASFGKGLEDFARIMKSIDVIRLVVEGEHSVALVNIDTVFGVIPFAEHIHVVNGQIVSIRATAIHGLCWAGRRPRQSGWRSATATSAPMRGERRR